MSAAVQMIENAAESKIGPTPDHNWQKGHLFQWLPCCAMAQRRRSPKSCARAAGW